MCYLIVSMGQECRHSLARPSGSGPLMDSKQGVSQGHSHLKSELGQDLLPSSLMGWLAGIVPLGAIVLRPLVPHKLLASLGSWPYGPLHRASHNRRVSKLKGK